MLHTHFPLPAQPKAISENFRHKKLQKDKNNSSNSEILPRAQVWGTATSWAAGDQHHFHLGSHQENAIFILVPAILSENLLKKDTERQLFPLVSIHF